MKKCSVSQSIRKIQIKAILKYQFTFERIIIQKTESNEYWRGLREKGHLTHYLLEAMLVQPRGNQYAD